jgi:large subunit ribosomal protein L29
MPSKMKDYRGMSDEQVAATLRETEKHLFQLRFQSATDRLETPSEMRKARREIAQLRTIQRERELEKLRAMTAEQLATRVTNLEAKEAAGGPGKRLVRRQLQRLRAFHAAKAPPPKPTGKAARPPGGTKGRGKVVAKATGGAK